MFLGFGLFVICVLCFLCMLFLGFALIKIVLLLQPLLFRLNSAIAFICLSSRFLCTLYIALQFECDAIILGIWFLCFLHSFIISQNVSSSLCYTSIIIPISISLCTSSFPCDVRPFCLFIILHGLTPVPNLL